MLFDKPRSKFEYSFVFPFLAFLNLWNLVLYVHIKKERNSTLVDIQSKFILTFVSHIN